MITKVSISPGLICFHRETGDTKTYFVDTYTRRSRVEKLLRRLDHVKTEVLPLGNLSTFVNPEREYWQLDDTAKEHADTAIGNYREEDTVMWMEEELQQFCTDEWGGTTPRTLPDIGLQTSKLLNWRLFDRGEFIQPDTIYIRDFDRFIEWLGIDRRTWIAQNLGDKFDIVVVPNKYSVDVEPDYYDDACWRNEDKIIDFVELVEQKIYEYIQDYIQYLTDNKEWCWSEEARYDFLVNRRPVFTPAGKIIECRW